tara:strand:+ start:2700 stop:4175 length:1476 start_codon:yes stop_codon:yes gene_type:complete
MAVPTSHLNLLSFTGNIRILHLTWFAFFITFVVWFSHAPLMALIQETFQLTDQEVKTLLILNVALAIPARIIIGMLVDSFGPRRTYSFLLFVSGFLCLGFAFANTYEQLAFMRFLLGAAGAGFVIGIRMVGEWFPARQVGFAGGLYGGWGNFGSAAAAMSLPIIALMFGGDDGWRYAIASTGILALIYSAVYFFSVTDTPQGATYFKPKRAGGMEVTSVGDFILYLLMNIPIYAATALLAWKLGPSNVNLLSVAVTNIIYLAVVTIYIVQSIWIYQVNRQALKEVVPELERYNFKQVAVLNIAYMVTFGTEVAMVSMLPLFFLNTFGLSLVTAGLLASGFALMNVIARPVGGLISDRFGRKHSLSWLLVGMVGGFFLMSQITGSWPVLLALIVMMTAGAFEQAGNGAVFAIVPLVKRRMTGQIAGMAGAYGSTGAVCLLTVLSFVSPQTFFLVIAVSTIAALAVVLLFLEEPQGHVAEVLPDGTIQLIEVT